MKFTLRQLEYFIAAGEAGSVTLASQSAHISAPSISAAIAHLERELAVQLFVRHHAQGLSLTSAGRALLRESKQLLKQAEALYDSTAERGQLRGTLAVGCLVTLAPMVMPELAYSFMKAFPGTDIRQREHHQEGLLDGLRRAEIDIAVTYDLQVSGDVGFAPLVSLPPYALFGTPDPLHRQAAVTLKELAERPMILLDLPISREYFLALFMKQRLEPNIWWRSPHQEVVRTMVANGYGYALFNARPALRSLSMGGVCIVSGSPGSSRPPCSAWRRCCGCRSPGWCARSRVTAANSSPTATSRGWWPRRWIVGGGARTVMTGIVPAGRLLWTRSSGIRSRGRARFDHRRRRRRSERHRHLLPGGRAVRPQHALDHAAGLSADVCNPVHVRLHRPGHRQGVWPQTSRPPSRRSCCEAVVLLLLIANTLNIAADVAAMGEVGELVSGVDRHVMTALFVIVTLLLQMFVPYHRYVRFLKWLTLSLLAYAAVLFTVHVPWGEVALRTLWPHFRPDADRGCSHGRRVRHDHQPLPVLLAGIRGGRRHAAKGAAARCCAPTQCRQRNCAASAGIPGAACLFGSRRLFHHPGHRRDTARRRHHQNQDRGAGGERLAPAGRRIRLSAVRTRHPRRRPDRRAGAGWLRRLRSG